MAAYGEIFRKQRLTPGQLRAVAERRFRDALYLEQSGENERANGAIYMGGFVIECLLKALLLERQPNLQQPVDPAGLSVPDREVHKLIYQSHSLEEMLLFLSDIEIKFTQRDPVTWARFRASCEEWTVYARYSPRSAPLADARDFLDTIEQVKEWLKEP